MRINLFFEINNKSKLPDTRAGNCLTLSVDDDDPLGVENEICPNKQTEDVR